MFQAEVYWQQPGESLPQLVQSVESLVQHVYPVTPEEMVMVLSYDAFVDPLANQQGASLSVNCHCATVPVMRVSGAVDGLSCPLVVDTGVTKTYVREKVVATQHLPVSDQQLCGVTGHCTVCSPMMSKTAVDVEDKGLELHCQIVKEGEGANITSSCGHKAMVNNGLCGVDRARAHLEAAELLGGPIHHSAMTPICHVQVGTGKQHRIIHVDHLWVAVEEDHLV
ncbi:hypothetical protein E2C01_025432 [Portunus trituberculatus]|uniref:Uncharacterized protein n=1 Tax=Portunus trituberculatus TaxID=210409 RepID=A0A5B7EHW8_PORTR|nr:hypothetical protein [Portunus trituberculatus]